MPDPAEIASAGYERGVEMLLRGEARAALRELEAAADPPFEHRLALAKAHLELGDGGEAAALLDRLLSEDGSIDAGFRAYLSLLLALGRALEGKREEAASVLEGVGRIDPRLEHAALALRRRIERDRPLSIGF
jgi:hypothetical protein